MPRKDRRQPVRAAALVPRADSDFIARRVQRHLADLERTNYTETTTLVPTLDEADLDDKAARAGETYDEASKRRKKSTTAVRQLLLYRKTLTTLLDESGLATLPANSPTPSYLLATAPPSTRPPRQLCSVCGYRPNYSCLRCGLKLCDIGCKEVHDETRCERR